MNASDVRSALADGRITVKRSARRRKTISVSLTPSGYVLSVPARYDVHTHAADIGRIIARLRRRADRAPRGDGDLERLAARLSDTYFDDGIRPSSVRWVTNQNTRWGSTTTSTGQIRLSHRLQHVPSWVLEAVLVHELAHLRVPDHGPEFRRLVARCPHTERSDDFLSGFAAGERFAQHARAGEDVPADPA